MPKIFWKRAVSIFTPIFFLPFFKQMLEKWEKVETKICILAAALRKDTLNF